MQRETKALLVQNKAAEDIVINWEGMAATEILHLLKACTPWNNGARASINGHKLKLQDAQLAPNKASVASGTINIANNNFNAACIISRKQALIF